MVRANGTNYFEGAEGGKRVKRNLKEAEGELRLIEKVGDTQSSIKSNDSSRNGLTPKKFFLMGVNVNTKDVEVTGLVSLVKDAHKGINAQCKNNSGPTTIQNGYCDDKVFFKKYENIDQQPGFIATELKNKNDKRVGVLGFDLGLTLTATFGKREITNGGSGPSGSKKLSRSAPIRVRVKEKDQNLYTGQKGSNNRPYVVVHDLKFAKGALKSKWKEVENKGKNFRSLIELGVTKQDKGVISKIPLNNQRQYYLWDPSYTEIKEGRLRTKNGHYLPWNNNAELPYTYKLIK
ncbi:hypothetical protein WEN_03290 [Mycoplasma wenyonii str. Massachusetts]|uniref:Uncharacterized protein n=1 Tax=Mycoplasma wenyonii (strain Massachusetts) TaxID=1197325 RepID=I6ZFN5_MYCWM|nr:hypothetical protein [Mycoplasma wenyonii]AFN65437.1 hypothetical protein WEN_03290 [Mycoplasma wenyonii str. Massachusetts]